MRPILSTLLFLALTGCAHQREASNSAQTPGRSVDTTTAAEQKQMTPDLALERLKQGHQRFLAGKSTLQDYQKQIAITGTGQYPFATILSCIDSRTPPEAIFDLALGDAFAPRIAGNIVNDDILGSLEFASHLAGSKLIVVLGHSHCGAVKGACDGAQLGNLTGLLSKIRPAVDATANVAGEDRSSKNHAFVDAAAHTNVLLTVAAIRSKSAILKEMERKGEIKIVPAMYDIETGKVEFL
jgi:carbonic anhydrase